MNILGFLSKIEEYILIFRFLLKFLLVSNYYNDGTNSFSFILATFDFLMFSLYIIDNGCFFFLKENIMVCQCYIPNKSVCSNY